MPLSEVVERNFQFPWVLASMRKSATELNRCASALTLQRDWLEDLADENSAVIIIVLPDDSDLDVAAMLNGDLEVFNHDSADLLTRRTILSIGDREAELWLDSSLVPDALDYKTESFVIVVSRKDSVWRRCFEPDDLNGFICGLQGAEGCSGPNYQPYRIWSEQELKEAAA